MPLVDDFVTILSKNGVKISDTSKNPFLQRLVASVNHCVTVYRNDGPMDAKIRALDDILFKAAFWLTSKPPRAAAKGAKASTKNPARWNAMTRLAERVAEEAGNVGVKLLHSPADFRQIQGDPNLGKQSYWLERADQHHRPGFTLSLHYEQWVSLINTNESFWDYLDRTTIFRPNKTRTVKFLGTGASNEMLSHRIRMFEGTAFINSWVDVFDTKLHKTETSGDGFAIFVCDAGDMYAASHILGKFHHSSFFAGMPVVAAGEIVADQGEIKLITAKSGHYRPSAADMERMVKKLAWIPDSAMIIPEFSHGAAHCYFVGDYRRNDLRAPVRKEAFKNRLPDWVKNSEACNKIHAVLPT
jgi:hypothetical protein